MARIKAPAQVLRWMKRCFHCDALSEGLGLAQWAAAGAKPCLANPHGWDYRRLQDKYRTEQLGLIPIRVTTDEAKKLRFVDRVTAQINLAV